MTTAEVRVRISTIVAPNKLGLMKTILVLTVYAIVVLVFFSNVIFGDRILLTYNPALEDPWHAIADEEQLNAKSYRPDILRTYLPRMTELSRSIRSGRLPLWNPYVFCGTPFLADPQSRVLYPISLLLVPFEPVRAIGYDIAIHFLLAMIGMYLFLRKIAPSAVGPALGGLSYGFSSFLFTRMGHPTFVASASWIPFLFYGFELARDRERLGVPLLAVFLAMGYLAGFPQVFLFGVTALVLYAAWSGLEAIRGAGMREITGNARRVTISGLLAMLLVSAQLLPFVEFTRNATGLGYTVDVMQKVYLSDPALLIRGLVPGFFGNPAQGTSWMVLLERGVSHENMGLFVYCGIGSFLLVCGSIAFIVRSFHIRFMLTVLIASVGLGTSSLLLRVAYVMLPYARYSQIDRVSVLACFAMSAIAGVTISMVLRGKDEVARKRFAAFVAVGVLVVLIASAAFIAGGGGAEEAFLRSAARFDPRTWDKPGYSRVREWFEGGGSSWLAFEIREVGRSAFYTILNGTVLILLALRRARRRHLVGALGVLLFLSFLSETVTVARGYYLTQKGGSIRETDGIKFLREALGPPGEWRAGQYPPKSRALPPNTGEIYKIPFTDGRSTMTPDARSLSWEVVHGAGKYVVDVRGKKRPLTTEIWDLASTRYLVSSSREPQALSADYPLIYNSDLRINENPRAMEKGICLRRSDIRQGTLAGRTVYTVYQALVNPKLERCGSVRITAYEPERIDMEVRAQEECLLVVQDTFYPGWTAYVDGERQSILRADIGFRAVELTEGNHNVVMKYHPASFWVGGVLSCVGLLATVLYVWRFRSDAADGAADI